jgi:aspartyl-tRNA(Asn)/glutamyl-tRNA(Gln) amidotransferase subunit A
MPSPIATRLTPLQELRHALASASITPLDVARMVTAKANGSASHNTYLHFDAEELHHQAELLVKRFSGLAKPPLYGVPVSLKDCFDLAGTVTTFGSHFYAERNGVAVRDSAMAARLRDRGCLITGKTHLHPLAYGITGENPDYGNSLQPRDRTLLTGGSSSGAAASVQEGSAIVAIGTDTGGSIRVPAALCGLVGFRASHRIAAANGAWPEVWEGASHLAASFDTPGFLLRDARDAPVVADALFSVGIEGVPQKVRIGFIGGSFIAACEPEVVTAYELFRRHVSTLPDAVSADVDVSAIRWSEASEIFAGIQAHEAASLHRGHFEDFEASIAQRLRWGESLSASEVDTLRARHEQFRASVDALFHSFDVLIHPYAPVSRLRASEDHSDVRAAILRYTSPFSLAGVPVLALPGELIGGPFGTGIQIAAAQGRDAFLLAFGAEFAQKVMHS